MKRKAIAGMLMFLGLLALGCRSASLNVAAAAAMKPALIQPLQQLASEAPETATAVDAALTGWESRPEVQTYDLVAPLIGRFEILHPERADSLDRVMRNWQRRVAVFPTSSP